MSYLAVINPFRYVLTISLLVWRYLPWQLRKPKMIAWLSVILSPLQTLQLAFYAYANESIERSVYNSQTGVLEYILNNEFNSGLDGIYISNVYFNVTAGVQYLHFLQESKPAPFWKYIVEGGVSAGNYTSFISEFFSYGATFYINIPSALAPLDENRVRAIVNQYVLADKSYIIQYY